MNFIRHMKASYFSTFSDRFFFLCGLILAGSEAAKQLTLTFILGNGQYNWWYFPFQLCSIPMYVLLAWPWFRSDSIRRMLLCFLMTYSLLGGIAVFADTSGLHYPLPILTVHSYLWHFALIFIGLCAGVLFLNNLLQKRKSVLFSSTLSSKYPPRPFLRSTLLYLACCLAAEIFNLSFDRFGTINMFYINPDYRMQQIVFRDLVPLIGNSAAILVYITASITGAFLLFLLWGAVFRILRRRR
ncbi:hypothetical protein LKD70_00960 [Ruminococcus sp. CLA-AA-H200]|uniref:Integral membrane protein (Intg_mem_TP0381) n=1 Tax=Ruminococcus turbiniformis TaxID=2881258 RepID=A0ABS8FTS5_9FIRM|nr:hypothetical protein [Ruminococcus turbiniformis]MCC2253024.1 hypothetical protein [Ruminococcus turbiniformis]